jgi:hexokinase
MMVPDVNAFMKKYGMHAENFDLEETTQTFIQEMVRGLNQFSQPLLMIPTYISTEGKIPVNEKIIVMDAGGTNLRIGVVHFNEQKKAVIDYFKKHPMPGSQKPLTRVEFIDLLVAYLEPIMDVSEKVGFCFSFPTDILPNKDGKLIHFNKEITISDTDNMVLGETINQALVARGYAPKKFVIINDTVATMLGGIAESGTREYDDYIGFILGTGTNTCYIENCSEVLKVPEITQMPGKMAINMESGGFDHIQQGEFEKQVDHASANVGDHIFEKMISGAYLHQTASATVAKAVEDGLFSITFAEAFEKNPAFTMKEISEFTEDPHGENPLAQMCGEGDAETLYQILDCLFDRVAKLVTVNLAGIIIKQGKGREPSHPVCISAEGTTFYKSILLRPKLDAYIREFLNEKHHAYCEFVKTEDSTLIGAAVAGYFN